ncbi:glycine oxidase ThiO [Actinoallomurus spadix]|uniref:Glycine oxidase ThiO n=1 Tax=Actinoallomurus spadix TaxID=79912 RepID=A0ABP3H1R4_9ACTN
MALGHKAIIVGGGIIGCAIAERIRHRFSGVTLVESQSSLGQGASSAAIGGITPQSGDFCLGPVGALAQRSRELYPSWLARIRVESGVDVHVLGTGQLQVATDPGELRRLHGSMLPALTARGVDVVALDAAQVRRAEPALTGDVLGGLLLPDELALEPALLIDGLRAMLRRDPRVDLLLPAEVTEVWSDEHTAGVELRDGRRVFGDVVVVAAGHLSDRLLGFPPNCLFPVKGQAVEFAAPAAGGLRHQCYALIPVRGQEQGAYVVPRADGRVVAGVTYEKGLADTRPTRNGREAILYGVTTLVPQAADWRVVRHWAGIRPGSADGAPVIGYVDPHHRLVAATAHHGLGITLAPVTADLVSALVEDGPIDVQRSFELSLCDPRRFIRVPDSDRPGTARPSPTGRRNGQFFPSADRFPAQGGCA